MLETQALQHQEDLEQNRELQAELERLNLMVEGQQTRLAELLKAQGSRGRKLKKHEDPLDEGQRVDPNMSHVRNIGLYRLTVQWKKQDVRDPGPPWMRPRRPTFVSPASGWFGRGRIGRGAMRP